LRIGLVNDKTLLVNPGGLGLLFTYLRFLFIRKNFFNTSV